jgi:hypothetical protein
MDRHIGAAFRTYNAITPYIAAIRVLSAQNVLSSQEFRRSEPPPPRRLFYYLSEPLPRMELCLHRFAAGIVSRTGGEYKRTQRSVHSQRIRSLHPFIYLFLHVSLSLPSPLLHLSLSYDISKRTILCILFHRFLTLSHPALLAPDR